MIFVLTAPRESSSLRTSHGLGEQVARVEADGAEASVGQLDAAA